MTSKLAAGASTSFDRTLSNLDEDESVLPIEEQTQRPNDVAVQQQRIEAWSPILDPEWVIYTLLILAVILIPVGKRELIL
jgi:cytochrome c-type biogenesis protein CcmH/NrfG